MNTTQIAHSHIKSYPFRSIARAVAILANSWLLIPALLFYHIAANNIANIPIMDDYNMPLDFVMKFSHLGFWEKLGLLFSQYSEHRLVPSKLIYISYYYLTGQMNFRILGLIGSLQLLAIAFVGVHFIKKLMPEAWRLLAFIWMLVIFDLNTYENAAMCMNAVGNYGVICYFFAAIYFYDKGGNWLALAILFQFMCVFSNANGLAAGVFIIIFNLAKSKRYRIISLAAGCLFTALYFVNYHTVTLPNKVPFDINILIVFFIRQMGAYFSFDHSFIIGLFMVALIIFVFPWRRLLDPELTPLLCIFLFAISTMGLAAVFRSCYTDAQFQTSRYLIYPQMVMGSVCVFVWMKFRSNIQKWVGSIALAGIILFAYAANYQFGKLGFERTSWRAATRKFWHPHPKECEKICKEACDQGIYCIEDFR